MEEYKFNPEQFGFEPIDKFPELSYQYPLGTGKWFIKISEYSDYGGLVYWYHVIFITANRDARIKILSGSHDSRKPSKYDCQNASRINYHGLISTHKFAVQLLKHILGTTRNESVEKEGKTRLFDNKGKQMREEFDY